jgi:hypothetical protein
MYGPFERGRLTGAASASVLRGVLEPGRRYRVSRDFVDFDGVRHPAGEEWTFLGAAFLPYEDGVSLFVSLDGEREWQIRMQWRPEAQGAVLDALSSYVVPT